jgi:hypothetical protein
MGGGGCAPERSCKAPRTRVPRRAGLHHCLKRPADAPASEPSSPPPPPHTHTPPQLVHPVHRLHHPGHRNLVRHDSAHLLPASLRGAGALCGLMGDPAFSRAALRRVPTPARRRSQPRVETHTPPLQDHRWWWRSFLCGGSTALFVFGYCFYYFYFRSGMSGFMQTSFFFLYMGMVRGWGFFRPVGEAWEGPRPVGEAWEGPRAAGRCFTRARCGAAACSPPPPSCLNHRPPSLDPPPPTPSQPPPPQACYAFFLMLGTIGWRSALWFVRTIFKSIHLD